MKSNSISIVGLGYIGLPLAVMLASKECKVFGYDKDKINRKYKKKGLKLKKRIF